MKKCPLCKSELSEDRYRKVIQLKEKEQKSQQKSLEKMQKAMQEAKKRVSDVKKEAKELAAKARVEGAESAKRKAQSVVKGQRQVIDKLKNKIKMIEQGTTPQIVGLADEKKLVTALEKEFPEDLIKHEGKGGDVLHFVKCDNKQAGVILYECKRTEFIETTHVKQAERDKKAREADFALLVTTGKRRQKTFGGLDRENGVLIVAQAGVLTLGRICRESLVNMLKLKMNNEEREKAAKRLLDYVTSPLCKTPLEDAISMTEQAKKNLHKEVKRHFEDWNTRHKIYETILVDTKSITNNLERVLAGSSPRSIEKQTKQSLLDERQINLSI